MQCTVNTLLPCCVRIRCFGSCKDISVLRKPFSVVSHPALSEESVSLCRLDTDYFRHVLMTINSCDRTISHTCPVSPIRSLMEFFCKLNDKYIQ